MHLASRVAHRALTESELLRQLCRGNLEFFARALAVLSEAPYAEIRSSLFEAPPALAEFWQSALLPQGWLPVIAATVAALIQVDRTVGKADRELFSRNVVACAQANLKSTKIALNDAQKRIFNRPGAIR